MPVSTTCDQMLKRSSRTVLQISTKRFRLSFQPATTTTPTMATMAHPPERPPPKQPPPSRCRAEKKTNLQSRSPAHRMKSNPWGVYLPTPTRSTSGPAVHFHLCAKSDWLYKLGQIKNREPDLLNCSYEEFPVYRWPRAKKEGLVGGYEKDTPAEIKNIQSRVNKIADVLEVPEESVLSYEFLNDPESVADVIEGGWSASSWAVIWGSLFKFLETIGHHKMCEYQECRARRGRLPGQTR